MRWWLCLLAVVACGDNLAPAGAPLQQAAELIIVAHPDDDLVFMQPDLATMLAARTPVTVVYVTAGDGGNGLAQATSRWTAIRAAYGLVAGSQAWVCGWTDVNDHPVQHCDLPDRQVSLVQIGVPDGGVSENAKQAMIRLFEATLDHVDTITARPTSYTRDDLIATLAAVIDATRPQTIRTLDIAAMHGPDHPDHQLVGTLTVLASAAADSEAALVSYRGYNINYEPATIPAALTDMASLPMRAYEGCLLGCGVCGRDACSTLTDPRYAAFVQRHYAQALRRTVTTGLLRSDRACLQIADDGSVIAGSCQTAPAVRFERDGRIRIGDACLELEPTGEVTASVDCTPAPGRTFVADDEGHLWAGVAADSTLVTLGMHALCLADDDGVVRGDVCGSDRQPTWEIVRPVARTPRAGTHIGATGRNVRIADLTGDGHADLCTITQAGLVCAPGDGTGHFGRAARIDPAVVPLAIEPASLALGDVDGDGNADACGWSATGTVCATAAADFVAQPWPVPLPSTCQPTSLAIAETMVCADSAAGLACAEQGAVRTSLLSAWPAHRQVAVGDLDGDGAADWCAATDTGPACNVAADRAVTTEGVGWGYSLNGSVEGSALLDGIVTDAQRALGDVDGDGRSDLCEIVGQRVMCARSQGTAFGPRAAYLELPDNAEPTALWLGDLDGDGKQDPCVDTPSAILCALSP